MPSDWPDSTAPTSTAPLTTRSAVPVLAPTRSPGMAPTLAVPSATTVSSILRMVRAVFALTTRVPGFVGAGSKLPSGLTNPSISLGVRRTPSFAIVWYTCATCIEVTE